MTPFLVASAALIFALVPGLPYGYFQLLRFLVCGVAIYGALLNFERRPYLGWTYILVAVLFNPLLPIHLDRDVWQIIDAATAVFFIGATFYSRFSPSR